MNKLIDKINNMRPRQLIVLAAICGLLMFGLFYATLTLTTSKESPIVAEQPPPEKPVVEMVKVVVAKQNIPVRTRIQESMLQLKELPVTAVPEGALNDFSTIINEPARASIFAGDVLTQQKIFGDRSEEGFLGTIPPDCRAVSISVNNITGVAGFAKPGDYVDLLLVEKADYSVTTNLLLQNVPLLSVNQSMSAAPSIEGGNVNTEAISNPSIATFALRPDEVLKLVSAAKLGEIYMMLRPFKPQNMYVGEMEHTIESVNKPQPAPVPQVPQNSVDPITPPEPKIEIIQGDQVTQSNDVQIITTQPQPKQTKTPTQQPQPPPGGNTAASNLPIIPSMPIVEPPPR